MAGGILSPVEYLSNSNNLIIALTQNRYLGRYLTSWSIRNKNKEYDYRIYDLKCLPLWEQIIKGHEFTKFRITIS